MRLLFLMGVLVMSLTGCIGAGQNSQINFGKENMFPKMTGIDLLGEERVVPEAFEGRFNIVAVAFEREQQEDVNTWIAVAEEIMGQRDDVRFYELPVIYELNPLARTWINNGMRSGIPSEEARERTITVYTERAEFLKAMNMDISSISTLLIDQQGRILWRRDGAANEPDIKSLKAVISTKP